MNGKGSFRETRQYEQNKNDAYVVRDFFEEFNGIQRYEIQQTNIELNHKFYWGDQDGNTRYLAQNTNLDNRDPDNYTITEQAFNLDQLTTVRLEYDSYVNKVVLEK